MVIDELNELSFFIYKLLGENTEPFFAGGSNGLPSSIPNDLYDDDNSSNLESLTNLIYNSDEDDSGFVELRDLLDDE